MRTSRICQNVGDESLDYSWNVKLLMCTTQQEVDLEEYRKLSLLSEPSDFFNVTDHRDAQTKWIRYCR